MSLISPKNFITPFTNAVNLATIIVIALLFGIYRFSGGGVGITTRKANPQNVKQSAETKTSGEQARSLSADTAAAKNPSALQPPQEDNLFDDLLDKGRDKPLPKQNQASKPVASSLDDIAKQLGVE